jgi:hypothetical protein
VLTALKTSSNSTVKGLSITALVRRQDQAEILKKNGTTPRIFGGLDDYHALKRAASEHDIVVHTASGFHTTSALALIEGLRERKKATGKEMHYIHVRPHLQRQR